MGQEGVLAVNVTILFVYIWDIFVPTCAKHGGLLWVAFCPSARLSVRLSGTGPKVTRKKIQGLEKNS